MAMTETAAGVRTGAVDAPAGQGNVEFTVLVARDESGTWAAWLRDDPTRRVTAADRDGAIRSLVESVLSSATLSVGVADVE